MCHHGRVSSHPGPVGDLPAPVPPDTAVPFPGDLSHQDLLDGGKPREACGVFAVYAPGLPVAHLAYLGIYALQHRGQESAGIATSDGDYLTVVKDMGLVSNVFDDRTLAALDGDLAIGHTRYSTTGSSMWKNSQPVFRDVAHAQFALGHNGNLVNTAALVDDAGMLPGTVSSDTDAMAELLAVECEHVGPGDDTLEQALVSVLPRFEGAFSLVLMDRHRIIGVRDPNGFRPLCLGKLDAGWVLASETPALDVVGAHFVRELDPGEMVVIDADGVRSLRPFADARDRPQALPVRVRLLRPARLAALRPQRPPGTGADGRAPGRPGPGGGRPGHGRARVRHPRGRGLRPALRDPLRPRPGEEPLHRPHVHRPQPGDAGPGGAHEAQPAQREHRGPAPGGGRRLHRAGHHHPGHGQMLREAGAAEVHMRVSSPPYRWPCFYGMDTGSRGELLAANMEVEEIRTYLNVDTLAYLTLDGLVEAVGAPGAGFCNACLTGEYPVRDPGRGRQGRARGEAQDAQPPTRPAAMSRSAASAGPDARRCPGRPPRRPRSRATGGGRAGG